ncbi:hypothetical protein [Paraconexibacter sp.]|uniref:hypothetical protein n=1 Tax=Paraconexibacter sp. TaxID=2949640 RepID=UPI0035660AFE
MLTAGLAGCTNAPPPTPARSKFAIAADKICANLTDAVKPLRDDATRAVENDELDLAADLTHRAAGSATAFLDKLAALEPPDEDRAEVRRWIADLRAQQTKTDAVADAIEARDPVTATRLNEEIADLARRTRRFAFDFGMQTCSK